MRVLKSLAVLGLLAFGLLAVQPTEAQAQPRRFAVGYTYNPYYPTPYYAQGYTSYYYAPMAPVTPFAVPVYPQYYYSTGAVYAAPGYPPVYGGYVPYYRSGFYYYRGR